MSEPQPSMATVSLFTDGRVSPATAGGGVMANARTNTHRRPTDAANLPKRRWLMTAPPSSRVVPAERHEPTGDRPYILLFRRDVKQFLRTAHGAVLPSRGTDAQPIHRPRIVGENAALLRLREVFSPPEMLDALRVLMVPMRPV